MFSFEIGSLCNLTKNKTKGKRFEREREHPRSSPAEPLSPSRIQASNPKTATRPSNNYNCKSKKLLQMSAGGAFGGNRGLRPVPPEKGIFPLDHMHLCDLEKKEYLSCLKSSGHTSEKCRHLSKKYLQCRMEKNLMAKQDMSELGFGKESNMEASGQKVNERIDKQS
ncbi:cytochrome c oxidase assembly protein COX19-like [Quercus lobata]|uniref:cytochrome c oxidase assembly protein COX19-like n=1 Tax=Quercus lobata TaxID=97700 RepID=UPI001246C366|nr:cytochrome c oxidase assembly protein COX19-like [Quercus lobata]